MLKLYEKWAGIHWLILTHASQTHQLFFLFILHLPWVDQMKVTSADKYMCSVLFVSLELVIFVLSNILKDFDARVVLLTLLLDSQVGISRPSKLVFKISDLKLWKNFKKIQSSCFWKSLFVVFFYCYPDLTSGRSCSITYFVLWTLPFLGVTLYRVCVSKHQWYHCISF